ncbi:MAG: sulfatase-like hydrolase/transferase, partial [Acinetobacter sp.]
MKPNFVIIIADQLRADALSLFGNKIVKTPHIEALAKQGVVFKQAYTQHSVCSPSRVSFLTGNYPHVKGERTLSNLIQPDQANFLKDFKENGYEVVHIGGRGDTFALNATEVSVSSYGFADPELSSLHDFMYRPVQQNIQQTLASNPLARSFYRGKKPKEQLSFDESCIQTIEQWVKKPKPQPWLLYVPLIDPHPPFYVEEPWFSMYDREKLDLPLAAQALQPEYLQALRQAHGWDQYTENDWREIKAVYYGMVSRLDDHIGRIRTALNTQGLDENTYIVFFSDHGEYLGDFGVVEKWPSGLHHCLTNTPLIISGPAVAKDQQSNA